MSFLINIVVAWKLSPSLFKKRFQHWCFRDRYLRFLTTNFFKEREKAVLREKKHYYKKRGSDIYRKSTYATFFVTSSRFLYFRKELAQFIVTTGIHSFISRKKSLKVVNSTLTIGFWRYLTCQISHVDMSPPGRLDWLIPMQCSHKTFHFLSVSDGATSILSDILISLRKSHEIIFVTYLENQKYLREMFLRRLRDVTEKTSFLRYARDVLKTSHKRHLFWDVFGTS